jgi:hypothetical protein
VDFTVAAGLLRVDFAELTRLVDSRAIPQGRPPQEPYGEDWYWHLDEFRTFAPDIADIIPPDR